MDPYVYAFALIGLIILSIIAGVAHYIPPPEPLCAAQPIDEKQRLSQQYGDDEWELRTQFQQSLGVLVRLRSSRHLQFISWGPVGDDIKMIIRDKRTREPVFEASFLGNGLVLTSSGVFTTNDASLHAWEEVGRYLVDTYKA